MGGIESLLKGRDDLALDRQRLAGNPRAGGCRVATARELRGDLVHIDLFTFRPKADPRQLRVYFFKDTRDHYGGNRPDMIDQSLRITAIGAGPGEVRLLQPE